MKKLTLFLVFLAMLAYCSLYLYRSGILFKEGIQNFQGKQNVAAGLSFAELITVYPYSPFVGVARLYMVYKDPANLGYMDLYYQTKSEKDIFETVLARTPAYYDPYFFASILYFLLISMVAVAQRYWAGSMGLSFTGLTRRDSFALFICVAYYFWVRGAYTPDTIVFRLAGSVSPWLNSVVGATLMTAGFSILMTAVNLLVSLMIPFTFLGNGKKKDRQPVQETIET